MDIIVYLCGMNFTSQIRYNPKTGRNGRYYRLKESYRNAVLCKHLHKQAL